MKYRVLGSVALATAIAFAQPVAFLAQEAGKAAEILALARQAIGDKQLAALKTFSVQTAMQRNVGTMQMNSDVEIVIEMPDKFLRTETPVGGGGMMVTAGPNVTGFNGDKSLSKLNASPAAGGGMVIRMMGPGGVTNNGEKPTPEQLEQMNKALTRNAHADASRLMLGWFAMAHPVVNARYSYAGEAESPDGKAFVIDVRNADGFAARLFVDEQTHLPLMVTYKGPQPRMLTSTMGGRADVDKQVQEMQKQPPQMADYTLFFDDWRDAEGVKFPFKMRRAMAGSTTEEWTISRIKINPKIDAKKFTVESGS